MCDNYVMYEGKVYGSPTEEEVSNAGIRFHQDGNTVMVCGPAFKVAKFVSKYPRWRVRVWVEITQDE